MTLTVLRFNFATPGGDPRQRRERLTTAIEITKWADTQGISAISVDEHHGTGHGWSNNPVLVAGALLACTNRIIASADCLQGPLWDPIRLAEDIALIDTMSGGRLHVTIGIGYRSNEYALLGRDFHTRGRDVEELVSAMLSVWRSHSDDAVRPFSRPHPPLYIGVGVRATAERAARLGLPLSLSDHLPELAAYYTELCSAKGLTPLILMPPARNRGMLYLHEDPDRAWAELGEHILWEAVTYGRWAQGHQRSLMHLPGVTTLDEVRESGRYRFLTPDQLITELNEATEFAPLVMHPLVGGMPADEAWKSLHLLTDKVLPALTTSQLATPP